MSDVNPLLSTRTVEGAAGAVESLLDQGKINKPITKQTQEAKADKVVQKKKTEEAKPTQEATETKTEEQPQSETQSEETQKVEDQVKASEAENAEETQVTDLHQVTVNGEKIDVNLDELKAGYQKDADYRRKTEESSYRQTTVSISDKDRLTKDYSTKIDGFE